MEVTLKKISKSSLFELLATGLFTGFFVVFTVFGVAALFGADTVKWNDVPVRGFSGLLLSWALWLVFSFLFTVFSWLVCILGLWLVSFNQNFTFNFKGEVGGSREEKISPVRLKGFYLFLLPVVLFFLLSYFWFDSARNYVHGILANELIDLKLLELRLIDRAIQKIEEDDTEAALKTITLLRETHKEDLAAIEMSLEPEKSWTDPFTLSTDTMENLSQFLKTDTDGEIDKINSP